MPLIKASTAGIRTLLPSAVEYALGSILYNIFQYADFPAVCNVNDSAADEIAYIVFAFRQFFELRGIYAYLHASYLFSVIAVVDALELHDRSVLLISHSFYSRAYGFSRTLKKEDFALLQIGRILRIECDPDFAFDPHRASDFAY